MEMSSQGYRRNEVYADYSYYNWCLQRYEGPPPKTIEMRIPQENQEECLKSSKTFKFSLPVVDMNVDTRCEPRKDNEEPKLQGVET